MTSWLHRSRSIQRQAGNDDNLIPLINIVFLLLIFFMIAGRIEQIQDAGIALPDSNLVSAAVAQPITLQLFHDNKIRLNNEPVSHPDLITRLSVLLSGQPATIAVLADKRVAYQDLEPLLNVLRGAGFSTINLFTISAEPG